MDAGRHAGSGQRGLLSGNLAWIAAITCVSCNWAHPETPTTEATKIAPAIAVAAIHDRVTPAQSPASSSIGQRVDGWPLVTTVNVPPDASRLLSRTGSGELGTYLMSATCLI